MTFALWRTLIAAKAIAVLKQYFDGFKQKPK
jgi:hypothetical protein